MKVNTEIWLPTSLDEVESAPPEERWKFDLQWDENKKGAIKLTASIGNIIAILSNDPLLKGKIRHNVFSSAIEVGDVPWQQEVAPWDDTDDAYLASYLEKYRIGGFSDKKIAQAMTIVADENSYHPVREYLNSLVWDGTTRIETLLIDHLKVEDTQLYREAALCFMFMAVKRVFEPGCNLQFMPVFIGKQGAGKSSLAQVLGGTWVTNSAIDINSKDGYIALQGKWIVEIAEMNSFSKKEASSVKSYISSSTDSYRPPYGQHTKDIPRQCIFFGTTNDILCLADSTGNRRFWPIECNATEEDAFERIQKLEANRDQLWAEAIHLYKTDGKHIEELIRKVNADMKELQEKHNQVDPIEDGIYIFLDFVLPATWKEFSIPMRKAWYHDESTRLMHYKTHSHDGDYIRDTVNAYDYCLEYLGIDPSHSKFQSIHNKVYRYMDRMPGWKKLEGLHRSNGGRARPTYQRVAPPEDEKSEDAPTQPVQPVQTELNFEQPFAPPDANGEELPF